MRAFRDGPADVSGSRERRADSSLAEPTNITGLLGYRLHTIVARIASVAIRVCEGRYGISRREWHVLGLLDAIGPQTPSQLAESCHLDRPRISRAISALAAKGLLTRCPVEQDHKRGMLHLTASGRELQRRVFEDVASINSRLMEGLDDERLEQLDRLLVFLREKADLIGRETAPEVRADRWRGRSARTRWPVDRIG